MKLGSLNARLEEKDAQLSRMNERLEAKDVQLDRLTGKLEAKEAQLERLAGTAKEKDARPVPGKERIEKKPEAIPLLGGIFETAQKDPEVLRRVADWDAKKGRREKQ